MRHPSFHLVFLLALPLAACDSCSKEEAQSTDEPTDETKAPEQGPAPEAALKEQRFSFTAQGAEFNGKTFDIEVADPVGYWLYDTKGSNTMVAARGTAHGLDAYFYAAIPMAALGTYEFQKGPKGSDSRVQIRFRELEGGKAFALLAVEGKLEFAKIVGDYLVGSFDGKFVRSERLGADIPDIPEDQRQYVTVKGGKFQVTWKDRLGGQAARWSPPAAPTPATP
jgi:hypothetical protein